MKTRVKGTALTRQSKSQNETAPTSQNKVVNENAVQGKGSEPRAHRGGHGRKGAHPRDKRKGPCQKEGRSHGGKKCPRKIPRRVAEMA